MSLLSHLRDELRPTVNLAIPLVLAELGWMTMSIVDTMMVGHLPNSAVAIGAVALSSNVFITISFLKFRPPPFQQMSLQGLLVPVELGELAH